jgi:antirestriction protein
MPKIPPKRGKAMSDYWGITFGHADGVKPWETVTFAVPDEDLDEAKEELTQAFPDGFEVIDCEEWEGVDFKTRGFSADEIWQIAEIANAQESAHAFLAWIAETNAVSLGIPETLEADFQKEYRGTFDDLADFARDFADSQGVPDFIYPHVNWGDLGRGLAMDFKIVGLSGGRIAAFRMS